MYLRRLSKRCRALLFVLPSAFACSVGQCVSPLLAQGSRRPRFVVFASLRASSRMAFGRLGQYRQLAASSRLRLAASLASLLWLATAPPLPLLRPARAFSSPPAGACGARGACFVPAGVVRGLLPAKLEAMSRGGSALPLAGAIIAPLFSWLFARAVQVSLLSYGGGLSSLRSSTPAASSKWLNPCKKNNRQYLCRLNKTSFILYNCTKFFVCCQVSFSCN